MKKRTFFKKIKDRAAQRRKNWEKLCLRCGICCYEKEYYDDGIVINMQKPCEYLHTEKKSCNVYANRFKTCKNCKKVTIFHALFSRCLPYTCGYVQRYRRFHLFSPPQIR